MCSIAQLARDAAVKTDHGFLANEYLTIENGEPVLTGKIRNYNVLLWLQPRTYADRTISQNTGQRRISFINQRHVTEQKLNEAIVTIINSYRDLPLQTLWGLGKSGSTDGTKWDLYPQNLMSEYHVRYGGYGGIGYYLIADSYIALFSRFTTCGSWEGHLF